MHFFIDENINKKLAYALDHLSDIEGKGHTVVPAKDFNEGKGVPDMEWLARIKEEGKWVIISKDRFKKSDPERYAFENAGITIFNLGKPWNKKNGWETAVQLIAWWPAISREVLKLERPMVYELPWGTGTKLQGRKLPRS